MDLAKKTVFVGLSGGVDSSVAALRLIKAGYTVVGVFIKVWQPEWLSCDWETERLDAMRVAAKLNIPFLTCDAEEAYKKGVADYFIAEYKAGRTPNPDVMCNQQVKFGAFLEFAQTNGADLIATGHYAQRVVTPNDGAHQMWRGVDTNKDQTYFLWTLTQDQLAVTLFPVGKSPKSEIRSEAATAQLLTAGKKDSQGICFLGQIDMTEFLGHYIELEVGNVLSVNGAIIGQHKGALTYTTGQRHGFTIETKDENRSAYYVVERDLSQNTITVSHNSPELPATEKLFLTQNNFIDWNPMVGTEVEIQTRYRQDPIRVCVDMYEDDVLVLTLLETGESVSNGQSGVLYIGDRCIGGGILTTHQK